MAFRKRNTALARSSNDASSSERQPSSSSPALSSTPPDQLSPAQPTTQAGIRPSPIDGRPTTSTGTVSLDAILAGHAGVPLGASLLIGETGTTDYAGALLRFYAAEGIVQGHSVTVVGMGEAWGWELPGLSERDAEGRRQKGGEVQEGEKMKIAWRYEGLGSVVGLGREGRERGSQSAVPGKVDEEPAIFCHTFDLAKRLSLPVGTAINHIPIYPSPPASPLPAILHAIQKHLASTPPHTIHRLIIPSLLSPALYPPSSSQPQSVLQFFHGLRALLRLHPTRLTCISTLPLTLYPRSTGLVRWMEHLSDGVLELSPFPYNHAQALSTSAATTKEEEKPQGMFAVHKLPVYSEKGGGGGADGLGEDLAFTLSRRRFVVMKFSLPPVEGDREAQEEAGPVAAMAPGMPKKEDLEF